MERLSITSITSRTTRRKRLLREILEQQPGRSMLLEELRWVAVLASAPRADTAMTRSDMNSFARTIREQFSDYRIHKVSIDVDTPIGLVAKMAVFRLKESKTLLRFLEAPNPSIQCTYSRRVKVDQPRYRKNSFAIPYHHAAVFQLFEQVPPDGVAKTETWHERVFVPGTHDISIIARRGSVIDVRGLTKLPWKLYRFGEVPWQQIEPTDTLDKVEQW